MNAFVWDPPLPLPGKLASKAPSDIRDRYIAARFPGIARSAADLVKMERIIPAARLFFEEQRPDRALELLELAIEQCPTCEPARLAQLEIAFLVRDAPLFLRLARAFCDAHPASAAWNEIARLGRALGPNESIFGARVPHWIRASWDVTAEVLASDFHRMMQERVAPAVIAMRAAA